jgi:mono/diheme cytochrome c family protein
MRNFIFILSALLIIACGGGSEQDSASTTPAAEPKKDKISAKVMVEGGGVYKMYCIACHMEDGNGVAGLNPPLIDTKYVLGDKERLITIVLNGLNGPIEVKGETYNAVMNPHNFLSDEQIANVLTYVRNSFGNKASQVTVEEVAKVRAANEGT